MRTFQKRLQRRRQGRVSLVDKQAGLEALEQGREGQRRETSEIGHPIAWNKIQ
jgi:hypothetical protein